MSFDPELQQVVLDIYTDVITTHFKKGTIPSNFPMKEFEQSMEESKYFFVNPNGINLDTLNQKNKFLIIPTFSYGHAFTAVVRKLDESDKISVTFVNLGARPFEVSGKGNQYKEFVYTKDDALKVLKDHSYNVRLHYPEKAVSTDKAYKNFAATSLESHIVNITSRDQKVGNCFLKNVEKGIRYALALGLSKADDNSFDPNNLRVSIDSTEKSKVKFLKPIFKPNEKTNDLTTLELRKELIKSLIVKFPQYKKEILKEWEIYKERKERTVDISPVILSRSQSFWDKRRVLPDQILGENIDKKSKSQKDIEFLEKMKSFEKKNSLLKTKQNEKKLER